MSDTGVAYLDEPTAADRRAFLKVLTHLARTHWNSDISSLARALLRKNEQALPATPPP